MQDPSGELTITGVVQREAWLQRAMPPAEQLGEDLWSLPVPIPDNPLRYVSVYAFGTAGGLVLIDAGWGAEESWQALRAGLQSIGAGMADVRGVLVTHMHFDHVGLAGGIRQTSGAWIAMHPADHAVFARSDYRSAERAVAVEAEFLRGLGASPAEAAAAVGTAEQWEKFTTIARPDRLLTDGELADVPGWSSAPAHPRPHPRAPVLRGPAVAPAVLRRPGAAPDHPEHLRPARRSSRPARGLPGLAGPHAGPRRGRGAARARVAFRGLPGRLDAIAAHHERLLAELLAAIRRRPGSTPWQLAGDLTWSRPWDQYSGQMRIFAVTETAAHAHLLERRGLATASRTRPLAYTERAT